MNNGGFQFNLIKLNLGYRYIIDVQVLPVPRLWLRMPLLGELVLGFTRLEVCSDVNNREPDYMAFDFRLKHWGQVKQENADVWQNVRKP